MDIQTRNADEAISPIDTGANAVYLYITGRFDAFETEAFEALVDQLLSDDYQDLVVDLCAVEFVDSSALAQLVRAHKRCRELGGELIVLNPSDPVTVILELTRLDQAFRISRTTAPIVIP